MWEGLTYDPSMTAVKGCGDAAGGEAETKALIKLSQAGATKGTRAHGVSITHANSWAGLILGLRPANERPHFFVTTSLIGWLQT